MRSLTLPLFSLGFLCLGAIAEPLLSPWVLHEKRNHVPAGWSHSHRLDGTAVLPLRFGLTQSNIQTIDEYIHDVADPDSPNYGKHWTAAEVAEKFAPSSDTIQTVRNWLLESGIPIERIRLTITKTWIELNATVEEAENLLKAEYHVYQHDSGKKHVCE
jgi:tripeptidyl-peptidase I